MNKDQRLDECLEVLDMMQETIIEILNVEGSLKHDKWTIVENALEIVFQYEHLSPEVKEAFVEMNDKIKSGEMTVQDAFELVAGVEPAKSTIVVDNSKKPLLN